MRTTVPERSLYWISRRLLNEMQHTGPKVVPFDNGNYHSTSDIITLHNINYRPAMYELAKSF